MKKKLISIILPIFNEEKNIPLIYNALKKIFSTLTNKYDYEVIMIDDGSTDSSWNKIVSLAQTDSRIKAISFSRNFGYQAVLTAGYNMCLGNAIITMDSDFQHPPFLISKLIAQWEKGFKIVYARRLNREDTFFKKLTARAYHSLLDKISDIKIPNNISDFRLLDQQVLNEIKKCNEKARYLRGLIAWTGFEFTFVDYKQPARINDATKYTWAKLIKIAFDGIASFSLFPLKIAAYIGLLVITTGSLMLGVITVDSLFFQGNYPLFKWLVTVIYIFIGILFILIWLLGEYIGRIYEEIKQRPLYIIKERYNTASLEKE